MDCCEGDSQIPSMSNNVLEGTSGHLSRGRKRKSVVLSRPVKASNEVCKKLREIEKEGTQYQMVANCSPYLAEMVDVFVSPTTSLGKEKVHSSLDRRKTGRRTNVDYDYHLAAGSLPIDAESTSSSVGSCSVSASPCRSAQYPLADHRQNFCSNFGDEDETSCELAREPSISMEQELKEETHLLELHAYRSTMMALYASGPISWEQEVLMTNLRLELNISNDEHLLELKNLVYSKSPSD